MAEVLRQLGSFSSDYYSHGMVDDGFCGFDPRAWIRFSRGSSKGSEFEDRNNHHGLDRSNHVNLLYYEELRTLSQTNLKLTFHPNNNNNNNENDVSKNDNSSSSGISIEAPKKSKRASYWGRPLPHLASFRCVAGSVPKIKVRTTGGCESGIGGSKRNPVFRSNSFRYEKYVSDDPNLDTISEKSALQLKKVVSVSEEYHTPKDLINRLPLLQEDGKFEQGTGERPRSSASSVRPVLSSRNINFENRVKMFEKQQQQHQQHEEDFIVEVPYTDPKDSKLYTQPGIDPSDDQIYKVYVGTETLYCRPYQHIKRGSKLMGHPNLLTCPTWISQQSSSSAALWSPYEDVRLGQDCVTIIPVSVSARSQSSGQLLGFATPPSSPSPTNESGATPTTLGSETSSDRGSFVVPSPYYLQSEAGDISGPYYENMEFHRVSITIPSTSKGDAVTPHSQLASGNVVMRRQKNRQVDPKSGLFVRASKISDGLSLNSDVVVDKASFHRPLSQHQQQQQQLPPTFSRKFVKFGYSQHEVWNWLHREDVNANNNVNFADQGEILKKSTDCHQVSNASCTSCCPSTSSQQPNNSNNNNNSNRKTFEVKFSAFEFLAASSRLSPLNLEGMESFVSSMLDKAINGRQKMAEEIRQHILFPKTKKEEKSSNFCTIRNQQPSTQQHQQPQQQQQQQKFEAAISYNNNNCKDEDVVLFGQSSCLKCRQNDESPCQKSSHQSLAAATAFSTTTMSSPESQVLSSHNYQSLYQLAPSNMYSSSRVSSSRGGTKAYTTLEALNQDMRGFHSDSLYRPLSCQPVAQIDTSLPLDRQEWYHGSISRVGAENLLRLHEEGSFLVRNSESSTQDFSLSVKSSRGFMHMRIQENCTAEGTNYILGQFSKPFKTVPLMVHYYTENRLPIKGAEHTCLRYPVCEELL